MGRGGRAGGAGRRGQVLGPRGVRVFFGRLPRGGNQTTRHAASGGMLAFFGHPDQWRRLVGAPVLAASAAEEIVRWVSPVNLFRRTAIRDTELRGQKIAERDKVAVFYASANRDPNVFAPPQEVDSRRDPN